MTLSRMRLLIVIMLMPILLATGQTHASEGLDPAHTLHLVIIDLNARIDAPTLVSYILARPRQLHPQPTPGGPVRIRVLAMSGWEIVADRFFSDPSHDDGKVVANWLETHRGRAPSGTPPPLNLNAVTTRIRDSVHQLEMLVRNFKGPAKPVARPVLVVHLIASNLTFRVRMGSRYNDVDLEHVPPDACFKQLTFEQTVGLDGDVRKPLLILDLVAPADRDPPAHTVRSVVYGLLGEYAAKVVPLVFRDRLSCIGDELPLQPLASNGACEAPRRAGEEKSESRCVPPASAQGGANVENRRRAMAQVQQPEVRAVRSPTPVDPTLPGALSRSGPADPRGPQQPMQKPTIVEPPQGPPTTEPKKPDVAEPPKAPGQAFRQSDESTTAPPSAPERESPPVPQNGKGVTAPATPLSAPGSSAGPDRTVAFSTLRKMATAPTRRASLNLTRRPIVTRGEAEGLTLWLVSAAESDTREPFRISEGPNQRVPHSGSQFIIAADIPEGSACDNNGLLAFTFELQGFLLPDYRAAYEVVVAGVCDRPVTTRIWLARLNLSR